MADITYTAVDSQVSGILDECFVTEFRNGYVKANGVVLPVYFKEFGQRIQEMEVRDDDVWVCSYPKTGEGGHDVKDGQCGRGVGAGWCGREFETERVPAAVLSFRLSGVKKMRTISPKASIFENPGGGIVFLDYIDYLSVTASTATREFR